LPIDSIQSSKKILLCRNHLALLSVRLQVVITAPASFHCLNQAYIADGFVDSVYAADFPRTWMLPHFDALDHLDSSIM
jgi:hypothetical protein